MNFEQWEKTFKPKFNHLDNNASFQDENGNGIMFETYGKEFEYVKEQDPRYVWTYGDEDGSYIIAGRRFVNRLGYFVCEIPWSNEWETIELDYENAEQEGEL